MTDLRLAPDAEALVHDYLVNQGDVAALIDDRVYSKLPDEPTFPLVRLQRFGGTTKASEHLDQPLLQIEVWAEQDEQETAHDVMQVVRAALGPEQLTGKHDLGVVTDSEEIRGPQLTPDPDTNRTRYTFDIQVRIHPVP